MAQHIDQIAAARAFGGLLFLIGAIVAAYNIWMTVRAPAAATLALDEDLPAGTEPAGGATPTPAE